MSKTILKAYNCYNGERYVISQYDTDAYSVGADRLSDDIALWLMNDRGISFGFKGTYLDTNGNRVDSFRKDSIYTDYIVNIIKKLMSNSSYNGWVALYEYCFSLESDVIPSLAIDD